MQDDVLWPQLGANSVETDAAAPPARRFDTKASSLPSCAAAPRAVSKADAPPTKPCDRWRMVGTDGMLRRRAADLGIQTKAPVAMPGSDGAEAVFRFDAADKLTQADETASRLLGGIDPRKKRFCFGDFRALVHPDDHARFDALRSMALAGGESSPGLVRMAYRLRTGKGKDDFRWFEDCPSLEKDESGGRVYIVRLCDMNRMEAVRTETESLVGLLVDSNEALERLNREHDRRNRELKRQVEGRNRAQRVLREKISAQRFVAQLSSRFIHLPDEQVDAGVAGALGNLGSHVQADRVFVARLAKDGSRLVVIHEWSPPNVASPHALAGEIAVKALPNWIGRLAQLEPIQAQQPFSAMEGQAAEAYFLQQRDVQAALWLPLASQGVFWGVLALEAVWQTRRWSSNEVTLVRMASEILVRALLHRDADKENFLLQAQLKQAQKMEAIGRLAGGMAHDFNNLLTGITGNVSLAMLDVQEGDPVRDALVEIREAADRAAGLTRQLLAFSRKQILSPKSLNLNTVVGNLQKMLRRLIGEDVALQILPCNELGLTFADPGQIEQAIFNLVVNARDAMPEGGRIAIETAEALFDEVYCQSHPYAKPGRYIRLSVVDTGTGMDAETVARIFEPFFTTKPKEKGTGLGLSMVWGTVKQHGGYIEVESQPATGTAFHLYFPRLDDQTTEESASVLQATDDLKTGSETVLVVEDEPVVREMNIKILRRLGYNVLAAKHGPDALTRCREYPAGIDLLMTDVVMPGMSGRQVAEQVKRLRPGIKILYASGYTENEITRHGVLETGVNFIAKPYDPYGLASKVRDVLDQ
ncbi:MAG: response regulator [Myxococcales bacterium]|nr:MAG: response regulator [Myxococcales bacterium]